MTHELEKLQRKGTKPVCPHCDATVLSTSQPERSTPERVALEEAVRLFESYGLIAGRTVGDPLAAGRWINQARAALAATPDDVYDPAYDEGITYAIRMLADLTGSKDWQMKDGSEDHATDVRDTIMDVLKCAGLYGDEDGKFAALATTPSGTQGALALYLNEVQPVDGRVQLNISLDEMSVHRRLTAAGGEVLTAKAAVAYLIDHIEYSDSYGVDGSGFQACLLCTGGGAPGVRLVHDETCPVKKCEAIAAELVDELNADRTEAAAAMPAIEINPFANEPPATPAVAQLTPDIAGLADWLSHYATCIADDERSGRKMLEIVSHIRAATPAVGEPVRDAFHVIRAYFDTHGINNARDGAFNILDRLKDEGLTIVSSAQPARAGGQ